MEEPPDSELDQVEEELGSEADQPLEDMLDLDSQAATAVDELERSAVLTPTTASWPVEMIPEAPRRISTSTRLTSLSRFL